MPTTTTNYALNLPTVGSDDDQWGSYLNTNFTKIDLQLKTLSDAITDQDLEELGNVVNTTPAEDQVLQFNGQNWSASTLSISDISGLQTALDDKADDSDLTGITTNPADGSITYAKLNTALQVQVDRILLTDDDATPADNQILKYSTTDSEWKYADLPGSTVQTLSDVNTASLADDAVLVYNSTAGEFQFESGSTLRTTLGVDVSGTDNSTPVTLSGSLDYLTLSGQAITLQQVNLTTDVTDTLPVTSGGTGSATASDARTALGLQIGVNTQAFDQALTDISNLAVTNGNFIVGDGTNWVAESGAVARASLGLGTAATTAASAYATAAQGTTADSALQDVVDDTTPQLGGDLDVNGSSIVSASNGNIAITPNGTGNVSLGNFTFDADQTVGAGQDDYVLTYDHSTTSISLEAASGGGISDGDKGDITVSGSGATWTIDSAAVTYAKIQNVSATDKLLGRSTAGAGGIEEISCTSAGRALLDDADAAAQRTTLGLGTAALSASGDFETAGAVSTHAALTSSVHGISSFGATLVDDADASAARTTLGLGTISTQDSNSVSITGGSVTGITDLAIADGGTGASTASVARGNLLPNYSGNGSKVLALNSGGTDVEWVTQSQVFTAGTANAFEHANSISDSITVVSGNNRLYIGDTTFSGTLTVAGKMVILDGPINLTGTMNLTGTLSVRH